MLEVKSANVDLDSLDATSAVSTWLSFVDVVAAAHETLHQQWALYEQQLRDITEARVLRNPLWYRDMVMRYRHGVELLPGEPYAPEPDLELLTEQQIVHECSVLRVARKKLRVKTAKRIGGQLQAHSSDELAGITAYVRRVQDAGVTVDVTSTDADLAVVNLTVYYDPLILSATGKRLDGTNDTPVQQAVSSYLEDLAFDGVISRTAFVDHLQQIPGVIAPVLGSFKGRYGTLLYQEIGEFHRPDAGWMRLDSNGLILNFIAHQS